jgi:pre-rRNA-processing protein TSR4
VCELQFTPALLRDVEDAVGMHKGEKSYLASEEELLAWDWQTVCVFTCPDSCGADAGAQGEVRYVRESVVVAESEASGDSLLKAMQQ